jgi:hypothetical protein
MKMVIILASLLALAACNACSGGKVTIQAAPVVQWDGGADKATHACAVAAAAGCPVGKSPVCAEAWRNASQEPVGSDVDLDCIIDAGPDAAALAGCGVTCQ